jgi:hypothetical protein
MRFFTPDLYLRFNSPVDAEANDADEAWEAALRDYRTQLEKLDTLLPVDVKQLSKLRLHDAELLSFNLAVRPFASRAFKPPSKVSFQRKVAVLALRQGTDSVILSYQVAGRTLKAEPPRAWPFSRDRTHWLYDEVAIDEEKPGIFLHRILWSDGSVLEIPFRAVTTECVIDLRGKGRSREALSSS